MSLVANFGNEEIRIMHYRKLGSSDIEVSVVAFGAWQLGDAGYWGADAETDGQGAVDAAIDAGITLFDTAEGYGKGASERALGKALGTKRDQVLIASKVSSDNCAPEKLRASCESSLERLGTDRIDLYQVHWPCRDVPFEDTYAQMVRLRDEGKIRHIGVSNFGPVDLDRWMDKGACVSNQMGYNLIFRAIEHQAVPACLRHDLAVLAYMPLHQGLLTGRWKTVDAIPANRRRTRHFATEREGVRHGEPGCEAALIEALHGIAGVAGELGQPVANVAMAWCIAQAGVASIIVGARKPQQVLRNIPASDLVLDHQTVDALSRITEPLKQHFGTNCDMWCGEQKSRIQ